MTAMIDISRQPPYSEEAELGVLGSILFQPDLIDHGVVMGVVPDGFHIPANRTIYEAMVELHKDGKIVDTITVIQRLRDQGRLEMIGGALTIDKIYEATFTASHFEYYVEMLCDKMKRRAIITTAREIESQAFSGDGTAEEVRTYGEAELAALTGKQELPETPDEIMARVAEMLEEARIHGKCGLDIGIRELDDQLGGLHPGAYILISGEAGVGKSTLARMIMKHQAVQHIPSWMWTGEQTEDQVYGSLIAEETESSLFKMYRGGSDPARVVQAMERLRRLPISIDGSSHTVQSFRSAAKRAVVKGGAQILFCDYLQCLRHHDGRASQEQQTSDKSTAIKELALDLRVPIVALSSLSREGNARNSGQIDFDAFIHIKLMKHDDYSPEYRLVTAEVVKHRFGPSGHVTDLLYQPQFSRFTTPHLVDM